MLLLRVVRGSLSEVGDLIASEELNLFGRSSDGFERPVESEIIRRISDTVSVL